jgi:hypothetical protein
MKNKKKIEPFEDSELHKIIVRFGLAMRSANHMYIAQHGCQTLRMKDVWNDFVSWCRENYPEIEP